MEFGERCSDLYDAFQAAKDLKYPVKYHGCRKEKRRNGVMPPMSAAEKNTPIHPA
jgi:hypothetical protein